MKKIVRQASKQSPSVNIIRQRLKSISLTKLQKGYENYINKVPIDSRKSDDPVTPRVDINLSNSQWRNVLSEWRKKIHTYNKSVNSVNIDASGFSPVLFRPNWFSGNLSNPGFRVLSESDFGRKIFAVQGLLSTEVNCFESNSCEDIEGDIEYLEQLMLFDLTDLHIDGINN